MSNFLDRITKLSPQRLALLASDLNANLEEVKRRASEPFAVIGLGCRYPGNVNDADSFWRMLQDGRDVVREIPPDRWDVNAYYDANPDAPGKMNTRWGGFLENIDQFDPEFFGISPREAAGMDPQQRVLLEVAWEALENAGQSPERLAGSRTGVFTGLCANDYYMLRAAGGPGSIDAYVATGNAHSVASGRISYLLGLKGPSVSLDTACSSSLVAVHLACQSLRAGDCRMALAGGVNLVLIPDITLTLSKAHMMSPVGRCKAFDASADGFVRAEGCGLIVLKRLSDAEADGDRVLAVIRGSACNQDGRSSGLTAPNGPSQVDVIREALANAGLQPADIDYIEAHGTGTSLGDPIEARALADVFGPGRPADTPLRVGSVKTNIGHAETAAGIAGLIKTVLALRHGQIPPSLHLKQLNPHIDWNGLALTVPTTASDWHHERGQRAAGVSSFGFSGTNAHVILGDAPVAPAGSDAAIPSSGAPCHLLPLSAATAPALASLAQQFSAALQGDPSLDFAAVCRTAGTGRSHFSHRLALRAANAVEAGNALAAIGRGENVAGMAKGVVGNAPVPGIIFLFTGQGAQYPNMARELFDTEPVFRRELTRCAEILQPLLERPLLEVLWSDQAGEKGAARRGCLLDETQYTQPALFAVEYALAALWRSWGIEPAAVLGHSVGEYVAACVAGVFSLEDGLRLIAARGRLMASLPAGGAMASVFADEARVTAAIGADGARVTIACLNGPEHVVLSGERAALEAVLGRLKAGGVSSRALIVSHAFHSPLMDPILAAFEETARSIQYSAPRIAIVSNVTGAMAAPDLMTNAGYWRGHIRQPVRFVESIRAVRGTGPAIFLEIGPQPVLTGMAKQSAGDGEILWATSLRRDRGNWETLLESAAMLYARGVTLDWTGLCPADGRRHVGLPTYPFQRSRYWLPPTTVERVAPRAPGAHPFLGERLDSPAFTGTVFERELGSDRPAFLNDHRIFGRLIMPSPVFIEMALAAFAETTGAAQTRFPVGEIAQLFIREPLFLPETGRRRMQLIMEGAGPDGADFRVCSRDAVSADAAGWRTHVTGRVCSGSASVAATAGAWQRETILGRCPVETSAKEFYDSLIELGLNFGDRFRGIARIWRGQNEALGELRLPESIGQEAGTYRIHPALLDACFHLLGAAVPADAPKNAYLLIGLDRFALHQSPPTRMWNHTVLHPAAGSNWEAFTGDIRLYDDAGRLVAEVKGLQLRRATGEAMARAGGAEAEGWHHDLVWREQDLASGTPAGAPVASPTDFIPEAAVLAEQVRGDLLAVAATEKVVIYDELVPALGKLCAGFILRALSRMNWSPRPGESVTAVALADQLAVVPGHRRLFGRLLAILAEEGWLKREGEGWRVAKALVPPTSDLQAEAVALANRIPAGSAETAMTARCGDRLDEVLRGTCDPLHLLFPNGDFEIANALYRRSPFARTMNAAVRQAVLAAMARVPAGRAVNILEIGAGTGGTSSFLLPHLPPDRTRYTFTDVSPLFLSRARNEFRACPFAEFTLLDIEQPPSEQGFAGKSFDIVIAANVLHATRDLRETLQHANSLLAPGGLLVLLEGICPSRWVDLTFGLTEGWWRFSDTALRPDYALIPVASWLQVLAQAGLDAVPLLPSTNPASAVAQQAILLARKPRLTNAASPGYWIFLGDAKGVAAEAAAGLRGRNEDAVVVMRTAAFAQRADYERMLGAAAAARPGRSLLGVVNFWPLDENLTEETTAESWTEAQQRVGTGVVHLAQALGSAPTPAGALPARLWLVTRGAQVVNDHTGTNPSSCQPVQAMAWGLARVISLEQPARFGAVIDLDPDASASEMASKVAAELMHPGAEEAVAYRGGRRLVSRIVRAKEPPASLPLKLQSTGSYLVTGGLGGLGLHVARWLAARGAGEIVLLSRREFPDRSHWAQLAPTNPAYATVQALLAVQESGARVTVTRADVADEKAMAALFARFGRELPPLRGVIHAAVAMTGCPIEQMTPDVLQAMGHAKAQGAWVLHRLTRGLALDFFVLFSSTTALWGVAGLGHYAAANQALDALAAWRRSRGLPALSVRWGTWQEMRVASEDDKKAFAQSGLRPMDTDRALAALENLIAAKPWAAVVASIDWSALRAVYEVRRPRPLFDEMRPAVRSESGAKQAAAAEATEQELLRKLRQASGSRRREILITHLRAQAGAVLGFDANREIPLDQGLFDMGMDSLMSVELKGRLERSLGVPLPSTLTFNYPTIDLLANYLLNEALALGAAPAAEAPSAVVEVAPKPPAKVERADYTAMTEDDLEAALLRRLKGIK